MGRGEQGVGERVSERGRGIEEGKREGAERARVEEEEEGREKKSGGGESRKRWG